MKISEIRGKDTRELLLDISNLRKEHFELHFKAGTEVVAQTARFKQIRRSIAQIRTVLRERELDAAKGVQPKAGEAKAQS